MVGVFVSLAVACLTLVTGNMLSYQNLHLQTDGSFNTLGYDQVAHSFSPFHTAPLIVAAGCSALLMFSAPRGHKGPALILLLILVIAAPLSWLNYARPDFVLPDTAQAALDLGLLFLGLVGAVFVTRMPDLPSGTAGLQALILGLILFGAVLHPGFFVFLWLCFIFGLFTEPYSFAVLWKWMLEAATVTSICIAWLYYLKKSDQQNQTEARLGILSMPVATTDTAWKASLTRNQGQIMREKLQTLKKAREALIAQLLRHAENLCENFHLAHTTGAVDGIITVQSAIDALDRAITSAERQIEVDQPKSVG